MTPHSEIQDLLERRERHLQRRDERVRSGLRRDHPTVTTVHGEIDVELVELILSLNSLGLTTQFCCQGDQELTDPSGVLSNSNYYAHVIFLELKDALAFMEILGEKIGGKYFWNPRRGSELSLESLMVFDERNRPTKGLRGCVLFPPSAIWEVTRAVKSREVELLGSNLGLANHLAGAEPIGAN